MKISATRRPLIEDFPEQRSWIGKLLSPVNDFLTQVIQILNGGVTFSDQMLGKEFTYDFRYVSDSTTFPLRFLWGLSTAPREFRIAQAFEDGAPVAIIPTWQYTQDGQIELTIARRVTSAPAVGALNAGSRYQIVVRVTP